jgi:hypothetical protein
MKKLMLVMAVLLVAAPVFAVTPIKGGVKVGMSMSTITGDNTTDAASKIGLAGGGFVNIGIGTLSIQPELLYVQKGAQDKNNSKFKYMLDYIEIPVLLKASFGTTSTKPSIFVGPAIGILMTSKFTDGTTDVDNKDNTNSMDLGLVVGAGVDISKITVDLRYELGLSNINKAPAGYTGTMPTTNNGAMLLMVGVSF